MAREATPGGLDLLVLHLLSEREMYGYEIVTELASRSNAVFQMKEGTLYPLLHRLEKDGAVTFDMRRRRKGAPGATIASPAEAGGGSGSRRRNGSLMPRR